MRLYRVTAKTEEKDVIRWAGTQQGAGEERAALAEEHGLKVRSKQDFVVEQVEVPTDKAGLLEWLNEQDWNPRIGEDE